MNEAETYQQRIKDFQSESDKFSQRYSRLRWLRTVIFLGGFALIIYLFGINASIGALSILPVIGLLGPFVIWHEKFKEKSQHYKRLAGINDEEKQRLKGKYLPLIEGNEFKNPEHIYTSDLDIFGKHSLFAHINRATTPHGIRTLAAWLTNAASADDIETRQTAVKELAPKLDLRQRLLMFGEQVDKKLEELQQLASWAKDDSGLHKKPLVYLIGFGYPALTLTALVLNIAGVLVFWWPLLLFLGSFTVLRPYQKAIQQSHNATNGHAKTLSQFVSILRLLHGQDFQNKKLKAIQTELGEHATDEVNQLQKLSNSFDARLNPIIYMLSNGFVLWDLHLLIRLEKWRSKNGNQLEHWFQQVGDLEALSSFANLSFNNPDWTFPEVKGDDFQLHFKDAGHPLIAKDKCVTNDLTMDYRGEIQLITGSNMAGKSTYLRTIGVNIVLAQAGAPCFASEARLTPTRLISSMRNADKLDESISSFYAELLRLKLILDETNEHKDVFFLIDEILKGTNSMDRHKGSVAMVKQLVAANGAGLISTHDLELAEKAKEMKGVQNFSFEVEIENGNLDFDYKKYPGICRSLNASILMKQMGIEV